MKTLAYSQTKRVSDLLLVTLKLPSLSSNSHASLIPPLPDSHNQISGSWNRDNRIQVPDYQISSSTAVAIRTPASRSSSRMLKRQGSQQGPKRHLKRGATTSCYLLQPPLRRYIYWVAAQIDLASARSKVCCGSEVGSGVSELAPARAG